MSDLLARLIEERVGPSFEFGGYHVSRATSHVELDAIYRFRYQVYADAGYVAPEDFLEPILTDEFDAIATQITVRDAQGMLVGATRFVPSTAIGFHTERLFDVDLPEIDRLRVAEFGRLVIRSNHRGGDRIVLLSMLKAVFECMIEIGTTHVLAFLSPKLAASVAALGCKSTPLLTRAPRERILENRSTMSGYFGSQEPEPVLYDLDSMIQNVGVNRAAISPRMKLGALGSSAVTSSDDARPSDSIVVGAPVAAGDSGLPGRA